MERGVGGGGVGGRRGDKGDAFRVPDLIKHLFSI